MPEDKKLKSIYCKRCKKFLCQSDGEFLFVENLEIEPKVKSNKRTKTSILKKLICLHCEFETTIGLKLAAAKIKEPKRESGRKFLIFRSRINKDN